MYFVLVIWGTIEAIMGGLDVFSSLSATPTVTAATAIGAVSAFSILGNGLLFIAAGIALDHMSRIARASERTAQVLHDQFNPPDAGTPRAAR